MTIRSPFGTPFMSPISSFTGTDDELRRFIIDLLKATSTRNSSTTCIGIASGGTFDNPVLLTVPANLVAIVGGRLDGTTWYNTDINGVHLDTALQNYGAGTNQLWPSLTPATQTTASLATGFYTLSVYGAGSALASGGTATITGAASATEGSPNTIEVTVAGTVTVTVTGALDRFQLEGGSIETAHIITTTAPETRNADVTTSPTPSVLTPESGAVRVRVTGDLLNTNDLTVIGSFIDSNNFTNISPSGNSFRFITNETGFTLIPTFPYAYVVGTDFYLDFYWGASGRGIRVLDVGDAEPAFATTANTDPVPLAGTLDFGQLDGTSQFPGEFANAITWDGPENAGWL